MYGRWSSSECSASSTSTSMSTKCPVARSSSYTPRSTARSPSGVAYAAHLLSAHRRRNTWWDGPRRNTRLTPAPASTFLYPHAAVGPEYEYPACGTMSALGVLPCDPAASRKPSSSLERCARSEEYHEPAWEASRVAMGPLPDSLAPCVVILRSARERKKCI